MILGRMRFLKLFSGKINTRIKSVSDEDIAMALEALGANLELAAEQLVQMANDNGGRDNVSVILVRVLREYPAARGVMARFFAWLK